MFRRLPQSGGRGRRRDALSRARAGSILCLCLQFEKAADGDPRTKPTIAIAIVASKKQVSKEAVERNRVKRRIRSAIQLISNDKLIETLEKMKIVRAECIIVCNRDCLTSPFTSLLKDLSKSLEKALSLANSWGRQSAD